jgi:alpha-beta hydrolase superfamily lysophospholipase
MKVRILTRWAIVRITVLGVLAITGLLAFDAETLFYYPTRGESVRTPKSEGLPFEEVYFTSQDGARLHGWHIPAVGEQKGVVLHVHGNMGNLGFNLEPVLWMPNEHYAVFMFDYRGYGLSEDREPNPKALMEDTQSAIRYLQNRTDIDASRLLILAQSLGGNNAIAALAQEKFDGIVGVVLDATFYSYKSIANDKFPGGGIRLSDEYSASRFIRQLSPIPLLFLHEDEDEVIPYQHSQRLFEAAGEPKQIMIVPQTFHLGTLDHLNVQETVLEFFETCLSAKSD